MYSLFLQLKAPALALALLLTQAAGMPPPQDLRPGALTGSVVSRSNPAQRYAVYLPSTFDRRTPAPILFVLDYRGRARVGAEVFTAAAERFGWIVMSSANSVSDEAPLATLVALQAMWVDAHDLFPVDDRRTYLAGLSGTARMATWVASELSQTFTGVIGAAAGFAPDRPPSAATKFLYFGTVGDVDYNYWEMRQLAEQLGDLRLPHRIESFTGAHGWMPPMLATAAIEWMELRAMQSGTREIAPGLVDLWWMRDLRGASTLEEMGRPLAASRRLEAMARDYAGLRSTDNLAMVAVRAQRLRSQPAVGIDARAQEIEAAEHSVRIRKAMQTIANAFPVGARGPVRTVPATLADLGIPALLAAAASREYQAALAARRLLAELDVQTGFYLPTDAMRTGEDGRATYYLDLAKAITSADGYAWFLRARLFARAARGADALDALTRAVALGFRTLDPLEFDPAFDTLRPRADFQALVAQVRAGWQLEHGR